MDFNNYALWNATHVLDDRAILGQDLIATMSNNAIDNSSIVHCTLMWLKSPHPQFTPWVAIPCHRNMPVDYVLCEKRHAINPTSSLDILTDIPTTEIISTHLPCPKYWSLIGEFCFRAFKKTFRPAASFNISQCMVRTQDGFHARVSTVEEMKIVLLHFLESQYVDNRREYSHTRVSHPRKCIYFERNGPLSSWQSNTDCTTWKQIEYAICMVKKDFRFIKKRDCIFIPELHLDRISKYRGFIRPAWLPSNLAFGQNDQDNLYLSEYLAKLPLHVQSKGLAIRMSTDNCMLSYPREVGDPPSWHS